MSVSHWTVAEILGFGWESFSNPNISELVYVQVTPVNWNKLDYSFSKLLLSFDPRLSHQMTSTQITQLHIESYYSSFIMWESLTEIPSSTFENSFLSIRKHVMTTFAFSFLTCLSALTFGAFPPWDSLILNSLHYEAALRSYTST